FKCQKAWNKTKLAQMIQDPKLKPFLDDLMKQSPLGKLNLEWQDLAGVAKGEMSFSTIPVASGQSAHVMTLFTNGQKIALVKLLAKVAVSLDKQGYKIGKKNIGGFPVTTYTRAAQDEKD